MRGFLGLGPGAASMEHCLRCGLEGLLENWTVLGYANDTLVIVADLTTEDAVAKVALAIVCGQIESLGLKIALQKTEAIKFQRGRRKVPENMAVAVRGVLIPIGQNIKYLGITLDSLWSFRDHFKRLVPKAEDMAAVLIRLMLNLRGPGQRKWRLCKNSVVRIAVYSNDMGGGDCHQ